MLSGQALAELALCLSLALAIICVGEPVRQATYLYPWSSAQKTITIEPTFKDAQVQFSPLEAPSTFGSAAESNDVKLFIPLTADTSESPLDTPSLDSLEQAEGGHVAEPIPIRVQPTPTRPIFFRSFVNTPASIASYHLKDARKLPLYEVQLQAGVVANRRRMTTSTRRRREAMLARIVAMEDLLEKAAAEEGRGEEAPFTKRGNGHELTRQTKSGKQNWMPVHDTGRSSSGAHGMTWDPMKSPVVWSPEVLKQPVVHHTSTSSADAIWDPKNDPLHNKNDGNQWIGPRAPGAHLSSLKPATETKVQVYTDKRYKGELEAAHGEVKPVRDWAEAVTAGPTVAKEVKRPRPLTANDFPPLTLVPSPAKQTPIAKPHKRKEVMPAPYPQSGAEVEELSKDGYRFSTPRGRPLARRELVF